MVSDCFSCSSAIEKLEICMLLYNLQVLNLPSPDTAMRCLRDWNDALEAWAQNSAQIPLLLEVHDDKMFVVPGSVAAEVEMLADVVPSES